MSVVFIEKMNSVYLFLLIVGLSLIPYNGGEFKFSHLQERLENHRTKICDTLKMIKHVLFSVDNVIDALQSYESILKSNEIVVRRKKRFLSNSFNPENWIRDAIKKLNLESVFTKIIDEINFKQVLFQVIRNIDITGMLKQSFGDLNKLIEKHLDIPNILLKQLDKIEIEPFLKKVISQLDIFTVIKNKIGEANFEEMLGEIIKKIDLKEIFTDLISRIKIQETIKDLVQYLSTDETIRKLFSAIDIVEILEDIINLFHLDQIFEKLADLKDVTSPLRRFLEYIKLDQIIEHIGDLHWILQKMLPKINEAGIHRIIEDFQETLEAVANSSTNMREILIDITLKKGIPFLIKTLDFPNDQLPSMQNNESTSVSDQSFSLNETTNTTDKESLSTISNHVRKKRLNPIIKLIRPKPKTNRILRILHVTMGSIISFFDTIQDTIDSFYITADMDVCW